MLPRSSYPLYSFTIPSTKKEIKYRPFITKDKKILLIALESKDFNEMIQAVKQILTNCTVSDDFDVDKLTTFDIEMYFLALHARSEGETKKSRFKCLVEVEGKPCGQIIDLEQNILDIKLKENPNHNPKIMINGKLGIMMKYPDFKLLQEWQKKDKGESGTLSAYDLILDCIDYIFDEKEVYNTVDVSREDLEKFVDDLESKDFRKIEEFFETIPTIDNIIIKECPKCHHKHEIIQSRNRRFFRLTVGNETLADFYKTNFALVQHHKWSLTEIEGLMSWERSIQIGLLLKHLEEERKRLEGLKRKQSSRR